MPIGIDDVSAKVRHDPGQNPLCSRTGTSLEAISESIRRAVSPGQKTVTFCDTVGKLFPVLGEPKPGLSVNGTDGLRRQNSALFRFFAEPMGVPFGHVNARNIIS